LYRRSLPLNLDPALVLVLFLPAFWRKSLLAFLALKQKRHAHRASVSTYQGRTKEMAALDVSTQK
jgi:hypothetical protein